MEPSKQWIMLSLELKYFESSKKNKLSSGVTEPRTASRPCAHNDVMLKRQLRGEILAAAFLTYGHF